MIDLTFFKTQPEAAFESVHLKRNHSLDSPDRVVQINSLLSTFLHPIERIKRDGSIKKEIKEIFRERYHFKHKKAFDRIWKIIGADIWSPSQELTVGKMLDIDAAFKARLVYHGQGVHDLEKNAQNLSKIEKFLKNILHGAPFPKELCEFKTFRAVLIKLDPHLLKEFRNALQTELKNLSKWLPQTVEEEKVWNTFLGNLLAFIPYTYPDTGEKLSIPLLKDGVCIQFDYELQVIPLHFNELTTAMPAIAMNPKDQTAPPILAFIGTTYPSGEGFAAALQSDFTPDYAVGELTFTRNREAIAHWMKNKNNVHVVGMSLGGAMAFHASRHHSNQIARVDVYNPPGLYTECWKEDLALTCDVNIHFQPNDFVSQMGFWPTKGKISAYEVLQHQSPSENMFSAHVKAYSGHDLITIIKHDPIKQNQSLRRRILTVLHRVFGPYLVYYPIQMFINMRYYVNSVTVAANKAFKKFKKFCQKLTEKS